MRVVVVVDDRVDRRARRAEPSAGRPVDLVAALARLAAGSSGDLEVDLLGWTALDSAHPPVPLQVPPAAPGLGGSVLAAGAAPPGPGDQAAVLDAADVVHVLPGPGSHPRDLDELLRHVPAGIPVAVSVPDRPAMPRFAGRAREPSRRWSDHLPRTAEAGDGGPHRAVHVITTEPVENAYVQAGVGAAGVASATRLGPGYDPPVLAPAYDVGGPVVLALVAAREAAEAVEVLRAAESLGRAGLRPLVVVAGVAADQTAAQRAATFAEACGVRVKLLGRASVRELSRWRATATVSVTTDRDPGRPGDLAGLLMGGRPVAAVRNRANKAVAARSRTDPSWYDAGESVELARVLTELLSAAHRHASRPAPVPVGASLRLAPVEEPVGPLGEGSGRGPDRHCLPTWDEVAEDVLAVYRRALTAMPAGPAAPGDVPTLALPVLAGVHLVR